MLVKLLMVVIVHILFHHVLINIVIKIFVRILMTGLLIIRVLENQVLLLLKKMELLIFGKFDIREFL